MRIRAGAKILFQGDSITNAFRMPREINHAYQMGAGYAMILAAHLLSRRPADGLTFVNRGVSGDGLAKMADRWREDCLDLKPDVLSILVGVNDTVGCSRRKDGYSVAAFGARYRELLAETRRALPRVQVILCEPFGAPCGTMTPAMIADVTERGREVRRIAAETGAVFVPFGSAFRRAFHKAPPEYWAYDGIHATAAGFGLMVAAWLRAVRP